MEHTGLSPEAKCNYCGYPYDTATGINANVPDPGDISVCIACGTPEVFIMDAVGLVTRTATLDEIRKFAESAEIAKSIVYIIGHRALDPDWPRGTK